ncbi:MAG: hypothetical protein ACK5JR_10175, partial [Tropicimonas sp.]
DHVRGGWIPELDHAGQPVSRHFTGKPDIYHSIQAALFPLVPRLSSLLQHLPDQTSASASGFDI